MFDETHYVPVLKARAGELAAVESTSVRVRGAMTPLFEVPPIPWDFEADRPAKPAKAHVAPVAGRLERAWGVERRLFVDGSLLGPDELIDGHRAIARVFDDARRRGVLAVPVWGPQRSEPYLEAVRSAVAQDRRGAVIRLESEDLEAVSIPPRGGLGAAAANGGGET